MSRVVKNYAVTRYETVNGEKRTYKQRSSYKRLRRNKITETDILLFIRSNQDIISYAKNNKIAVITLKEKVLEYLINQTRDRLENNKKNEN